MIDLGRIATALERIVGLLEESPRRRRPLTNAEIEQRREAAKKRRTTNVVRKNERTTNVVSVPPTNPIQALIGVYVRHWQAKYQTKSRPATTKAIGVFKALLKERSVDELSELLQVYLQMSDPWFMTKHHDIVTFGENVGKIAVAHDKGHEAPNGEKHWTQIYEERVKKEKNERDGFRDADQPTQLTVAEDVWRRT